jgi:excisionase family DNA binding protein
MTPEEAAEFLGVGRATIFRWMRDGKLSHVKVGRATRFRQRDLEAVQRQVTATDQAVQLGTRCAVCGHGFLLAGTARSTGKLYFQPDRAKFWVLTDSMAELKAYACPVCGHVQMHADTAKLAKLMKPEDEAASQAAGQPEPPRRQDAESDGGGEATADERG